MGRAFLARSPPRVRARAQVIRFAEGEIYNGGNMLDIANGELHERLAHLQNHDAGRLWIHRYALFGFGEVFALGDRAARLDSPMSCLLRGSEVRARVHARASPRLRQ